MAFMTLEDIGNDPFFERCSRDPLFLREGLEGLAIALNAGWRPDEERTMQEAISEAIEESYRRKALKDEQ